MRTARLYVDDRIYGSVPVAGKLPRVITWLGEAFVRQNNTFKYHHVATIQSSILLRPDSPGLCSRDKECAERVRKVRL